MCDISCPRTHVRLPELFIALAGHFLAEALSAYCRPGPNAWIKAAKNAFAAAGSFRHSATVTPRASHFASSGDDFLRFPWDFDVNSSPTGGACFLPPWIRGYFFQHWDLGNWPGPPLLSAVRKSGANPGQNCICIGFTSLIARPVESVASIPENEDQRYGLARPRPLWAFSRLLPLSRAEASKRRARAARSGFIAGGRVAHCFPVESTPKKGSAKRSGYSIRPHPPESPSPSL
jgi:hypothetical protein